MVLDMIARYSENDVGEPIIDVGVVQPRVSIIWDPWADAQTKLVANYGRFSNTGRIGVADYFVEKLDWVRNSSWEKDSSVSSPMARVTTMIIHRLLTRTLCTLI